MRTIFLATALVLAMVSTAQSRPTHAAQGALIRAAHEHSSRSAPAVPYKLTRTNSYGTEWTAEFKSDHTVDGTSQCRGSGCPKKQIGTWGWEIPGRRFWIKWDGEWGGPYSFDQSGSQANL